MRSSCPNSRRFLLGFGLPSIVALTSLFSACGGDSKPEGATSGLASALDSPPPVQPLAGPVNLENAFWRHVSMPFEADSPTAVAIDGARVLVTGGLNWDGDATVKDAYLFNPGNDQWTALPPMNEGRLNHSATRLSDGRVLVAGGEQRSDELNGFSKTSEIFDPATSKWTKLSSGIGIGRSSHTATLLPDGRVLIVGGAYDDGFTGAVNFFEPNAGPSGAWVDGPWFSPGRGFHAATLLQDGSVLVTGGHQDFGFSMPSVMELVISDEEFWSERSTLYGGRSNHTATLLDDGRVLVTGGRNNDNVPIGTVEIYGPPTSAPVAPLSTPTWYFQQTQPMALERVYHTAARLPDGRVLVVGGRGMNGAIRLTEVFDPASDTWSLGPELNFGRSHHQMVVQGARITVVGGLDDEWRPLASVEILEFGAKLGETCSDEADCNSGFCVDGVCCDTSCEGACVACLASQKESGANGFCGPIQAGTNPRESCSQESVATCGMTGTCDGKGACAVYEDGTSCDEGKVCSGGVCQVESGTHCTGQIDGTQCGDDDGCTTGICRQQVCETTHKLDGSPCKGGVCIAGQCKLDREPGSSVDVDGGSGGATSDGGTPGGGSGAESSDDKEDGGGLCSAAPGAPGHSPMVIGMALLVGLGAIRRRSRALDA